MNNTMGCALEEGMATHSSILAWRIPWTEEPGGLQSIGLHRVGYDSNNLLSTCTGMGCATRREGFPSGSHGKESACTAETQVRSLGQEDPWRREWLPTPVFLPGEFHGQRSLATVHGVTKSQT